MKPSKSRNLATAAKSLFASVICFFLYRGMKVLYKLDTRVKEEIDSWAGGRTIV